MRELLFDTNPAPVLPAHRRSMTSVTILLHIVLLLVVIRIGTRPVRMSPGGPVQTGIAAYVPGPVGTAGSSPAKPAIAPKKAPTIARAAKPAPKEDQSDAAQSQNGAGSSAGQPGGGPVRLSGGSAGPTLLTKITPIYPAIMQSARLPGQVVLDAIIHRDGTIGDVKILQSTNDAFAQSAVAAVKQWRYSPIPYEGVLTVSVNFTIPR